MASQVLPVFLRGYLSSLVLGFAGFVKLYVTFSGFLSLSTALPLTSGDGSLRVRRTVSFQITTKLSARHTPELTLNRSLAAAHFVCYLSVSFNYSDNAISIFNNNPNKTKLCQSFYFLNHFC